MADPHVTTGTLIGASVSPTLLLLGAQVDALVVGLVAAVFATFRFEAVDSKPKAAGAVLLSSMLAGYGSPLATAWALTTLPFAAAAGDVLRLLCAAIIGAMVTAILPSFVNWAKGKFKGV